MKLEPTFSVQFELNAKPWRQQIVNKEMLQCPFCLKMNPRDQDRSRSCGKWLSDAVVGNADAPDPNSTDDIPQAEPPAMSAQHAAPQFLPRNVCAATAKWLRKRAVRRIAQTRLLQCFSIPTKIRYAIRHITPHEAPAVAAYSALSATLVAGQSGASR